MSKSLQHVVEKETNLSSSITDNTDQLRAELEQLRSREREIVLQLSQQQARAGWSPQGYYGTYYALTGSLLGLIAAMVSLLLNVVGSVVAGKESALELIRVYLTFPLGEKALALTGGAQSIGSIGDGMILAIGCCLYLFTGMLLGVPIYMALAKFTAKSGTVPRLVVGAVIGLGVWAVNFYGILSWLQPLLYEKDFITSGEYLPPWVAAATHVVFGLTIAVMYPLGEFRPYSRPAEES